MELYQAVILGIVQGLTEFLPVSSSGHLVLGQLLFGLKESQLSFDISVHMGTLLAVVLVYFSDIRAIVGSVFNFGICLVTGKSTRELWGNDPNLKLAAMIIVGSVPTAIIGLVLKQYEHFLFSSGALVGFMLLITGTILWISRKYYSDETIEQKSGISQAMIVGISQGLAVLPGMSRSGTTIAVGMFTGLDRKTAAKFSFLLSIPAICGAQLLGIKDMVQEGQSVSSETVWATLAAFIVGFAALKILLRLVHTGKFHLFAPYCWLIGAIVLISKIL